MYTDSSRNPMSAMQGVDMLLAPVLRALEAPRPRHYQYETRVSLDTHNRLLEQYNELVAASQAAILSLRVRAMELEMQNLRLKARVAEMQRR